MVHYHWMFHCIFNFDLPFRLASGPRPKLNVVCCS